MARSERIGKNKNMPYKHATIKNRRNRQGNERQLKCSYESGDRRKKKEKDLLERTREERDRTGYEKAAAYLRDGWDAE